MNSTPVPWPACSSATSFRISAWVVTSSAVVGSSAISRTGSSTRGHGDHDALALTARELVRIGGVDALRLRQLHAVEDGDDLGLARRRVELGVGLQHLVDLLAAGHDRVERRHRLLEDHRHARAAQLAQARFARGQDVLAFEQDLARGRLQRLGEQPHHGEGDHRLARARLAHQADDLAGIDGEAHLFDGMDAVAAGRAARRSGYGLPGPV